MDDKTDSWLKRALSLLPEECMEPGEYVGPAWGDEGQTVRIRCSAELPDAPFGGSKTPDTEIEIAGDCTLLQPVIKPREQKPREQQKKVTDHTAALTVGKLVHKGIELWRFPDEKGPGPVLEEAFRKILLLTDNLDPAKRQTVLEKAEMLLSRFRDSKERLEIGSAEKRWHEIPFSFTKWNYTVNGVIDLLIKTGEGYAVIDFKTDELKSYDDLKEAVDRHSRQLEEYRKALSVTLGEDPRCYICFLDYCGKVSLYPVGKDAAVPSEEEEKPDEWPPEEPEEDDDLFEERLTYSDLFPAEE